MTNVLTVELQARLSAWYGVPVYVGPPETRIRGKSVPDIIRDEAYERYREVIAAQDRLIREWAAASLNEWVDALTSNTVPAAFKTPDAGPCTDTAGSFWVYHPEHHTWTLISPTTALAADTETP